MVTFNVLDGHDCVNDSGFLLPPSATPSFFFGGLFSVVSSTTIQFGSCSTVTCSGHSSTAQQADINNSKIMKMYFINSNLFAQTITIFDQACKNQPCECKKLLIFYFRAIIT